MRLIKRYKKMLVVLGLLVIAAVLVSDSLVHTSTKDGIFSVNELEDVPQCKTALVLGCRPGSYYFRSRIEAAAELYRAGIVKYVLVSGDNSRANYNESSHMATKLEKLGVPREKIYRDYAGFRTLDSVVRAKEIFGQDKLVIVSQRFHAERAVYLARNNGIDAVGFCAAYPRVGRITYARMFLRERLARVKAVADIILNVQPHFMGNKIEIGEVVQNPLPEEISMGDRK